jgi:hypothetical protein
MRIARDRRRPGREDANNTTPCHGDAAGVGRLDLGLVDAGSNDACALCLDGMLVTGPDGALEVVPYDAGEMTSSDAEAALEQ